MSDDHEECEGCPECEISLPLAKTNGTARALDLAVSIIDQLEADIPKEEDLENMSLQVNAKRLYEMCDSLLMYADFYEDVNVSEMFEMVYEIREKVKLPYSTTKH